MRIIGCDLHARQQTLAMLDTVSGEVVNRTLMHEGKEVREFYSKLPRPVLVGAESSPKIKISWSVPVKSPQTGKVPLGQIQLGDYGVNRELAQELKTMILRMPR
jgi:hypothetical protein